MAAIGASGNFTLQVPRTLFKEPFGFSLDIGGSCAKLAYYDVNDSENGPEVINLHLVLFVQNETEKVCEHLMKKFSLPGNPEWADRQVYTTGIGGSQYIDIFKKKLGVSIKNITEMDCFVKAFRVLRKALPKELFTLEKSEEAKARAAKFLSKEMLESWEKTLKDHSDMKFMVADTDDKKPAESDNGYPCALCMFGSGAMCMKVGETGGFEAIDGITMAGRMFLGIGSLLTGGKGYDEILELAERGSIDDVCTMSTDFMLTGDNDDLYSSVKDMPKMPTFMFGKAVGKTLDDFNAEDLARTWVTMYAAEISQLVPLHASTKNLSEIFFVGNFFNHPLIREEVTYMMELRKLAPMSKSMDYEFVRYGGHFGAIGALMTENLSSEVAKSLE